MICRERIAQRFVAHARPRRKSHFCRLQMQSSVRKHMQTAGVVVMQMGHDHFANGVCRNSQRGQSRPRVLQNWPPARAGFFGVVPGVHKDRSVPLPQYPYEIIHRMRRIVSFVKDKAVAAHTSISISVFYRVYLPVFQMRTPLFPKPYRLCRDTPTRVAVTCKHDSFSPSAQNQRNRALGVVNLRDGHCLGQVYPPNRGWGDLNGD